MSAVDAAQRAARVTDPICHSLGLLGMLAGMLVGAIVGAILIAGAIATGGALVIALGVCAAGGAVAMGGLSGGQLARGIQTAFGLSDPQTGVLGPIGSPNIMIGGLFATRMGDPAIACDGIMTLLHPIPIPAVPIAEGSMTVRFNNLAAARVTSKLFCGAKIKDGEPTVLIGGPTERDPDYIDPEEMLTTGLEYLLAGSLIGAAILTFAIGGAAALLEFGLILGAFFVANELLGVIGDMIGPGWRDILQGIFGLGAIIAGGIRAFKEFGKIGETAREKAAAEQAAREQAAREQAAREQAAREQAAREQAAREQAAREQAAREQAAREQAAREQAAREQAAREQAAREQAAREEAAREQAAREQAAREEAERRAAERERHLRELGTDPRNGQFRRPEAEAGERLEQRVGPLERDPTGDADWIDGNGETYDAVGPAPPEHVNTDRFNDAIDDHLLKQGLDHVVVDMTGMTPQQRAAVQQHIDNLPADQQNRIIVQGN